jgi:hypothetical protein
MHVTCCPDPCKVQIGEKVQEGYVPTDVVFGKGEFKDHIEFDICLDCGQMQGEWPNPLTSIET